MAEQVITPSKTNNQADYFFNRELSWLDFNYRVIEEAYDPNNPFLEQLNFLAIGSSNLDEFFMVRVAGVYDQYLDQVEIAENKTLMSPDQLLDEISTRNRRNINYQYQRFHQIVDELVKINYQLKRFDQLNEEEAHQADLYFNEFILPTLTPLGVDSHRPFPHLKNKHLNIYVELQNQESTQVAIVPIPSLIDRFLTITTEDSTVILMIEDMIIHHLSQLFVGYTVTQAFPFRITRNADFDVIEDGASDLLELIEDYVQKRRNGIAIRLEVDTSFSNNFKRMDDDFIQNTFNLEERAIYYFDGPLDLTFLFELVDEIGQDHPELQYPPFKPYLDPSLMGETIFDQINERDIFFHHPYDSFDPIVSFIQTAAKDPQTIAIKQTLYRVSKHSPIIQALKEAADNGKEVTVLVELKARFDEANNIHWARELEEAGCHVLYGMSDLKTHSKICLAVRQEDNGIKRYVHLGTGNYNDKTARTYTDMGILTAYPEIGQDASDFFNYLSGYTQRPDYQLLQVSPFAIRDSLLDYIDEEISYQEQYGNGYIIAKMNSLTDKPLIEKLYQASQAGVKIDLIVRGICCLKPGIPNFSDNIQVRSIVGRFLEHSRVYYFHHNGQHRTFLSSADMMTRNMIKRVEIEFPILDPVIAQAIRHILDLQLADTMKARVLQEDGCYVRPDQSQVKLNNHNQLIEEAAEKNLARLEEPRSKDSSRLPGRAHGGSTFNHWLKRILSRKKGHRNSDS
ncbi:RNA degradosome polyphosphate kinase [Hutsoniella sourekii]|uniref:RNA degradosome polyphosphate kinase n=1 Tax=Hutsoniella sourekii TaxID=87650 RepID=UPI0004B43D3F|nr:RNA degradosome polyphosphate kinase [Hutsoniella sourekii]